MESVVLGDHWPVVVLAALMSVEVEKATTASETLIERAPGVPLKSRTLGRKRSLAVVGRRMAVAVVGAAPRAAEPSPMEAQVEPLSVEYCQTPCVVESEALATMAMPPKVVEVSAAPVMALPPVDWLR